MNIWQMFRAYGGMVFGQTDYWHPDMPANAELNSGKVDKYPVAMGSKAYYSGEFDSRGIPLVEIDGQLCYLPVTIAQWALGHYDEYIDHGGELHQTIFLCAADWLVENQAELRPGLWGWINEHDKEIYALKAPWLSALSQGQALSVLARAHLATQDEKYLKCGDRALRAFSVPGAQGGVQATLEGGIFYEEYPSAIPSYVLNGFIFALWGLWEFFLAGENPEAKAFYEQGLQTLKKNVMKFDAGRLKWSLYDLYPFRVADIASIFYHKLQIEQLRAMFLLSGEEVFATVARRWEKGRRSRLTYVLATAAKIRHKLSIRRQSSYVAKRRSEVRGRRSE
ncbi:heparosan-N-sulfate-glucuronate 5-epimerase [Acididesulfobacillus acetoxydans]|uniref:D-glucuronyl C5-epimerase domain protein n=1 Tax=Acididesulfobacillus acetoxydans TaxID=1561005 RepID=A0A8S0XAA2_9FIRM|nr:D-glucuronyl C5-epimerase family protein [Acididesulfobacillus acetoxydans]CAA7599626.1 heparosan-N-sulfate-glucuronate 5-epimerase [Acididesulfobacillus acetoxydans]CEJ06463.1 D-glucuronyl C5-epimerase domain protein [Acididesulfobacillus acetoxydans]